MVFALQCKHARRLKGIEPADLRKSGCEIRAVVKLEAAKGIGVTIPRSFFLCGDKVIRDTTPLLYLELV